MIKRIKLFFARLFCLHQWERNIVAKTHFNNIAIYGQGIMREYICKRCGKICLKTEDPISFYENKEKENNEHQ